MRRSRVAPGRIEFRRLKVLVTCVAVAVIDHDFRRTSSSDIVEEEQAHADRNWGAGQWGDTEG